MRGFQGSVALALAVAVGCSNPGGEAAASANEAQPEQRAPARAAPAPGASRGVEDPRAFIQERYRRLAEDQGDPAAYAYSDRLRALFADMERDAGDELGRLDFDYWSNSQDPLIRDLRLTQEDVSGHEDRRVVTAQFSNAGTPNTNRFYFERVGGRWYLDDVQNETRGENGGGWTLSLILKYGH